MNKNACVTIVLEICSVIFREICQRKLLTFYDTDLFVL
jgi:hypothetical protein